MAEIADRSATVVVGDLSSHAETHLLDTRAYLDGLLGVPAEGHDVSVQTDALVAAGAAP